MATVEKKTLKDLLVNDLRKELEKRGLDKSGVKSVLLERLQMALESEGKDPSTFCFDVAEGSKKIISAAGTGDESDLYEATEAIEEQATPSNGGSAVDAEAQNIDHAEQEIDLQVAQLEEEQQKTADSDFVHGLEEFQDVEEEEGYVVCILEDNPKKELVDCVGDAGLQDQDADKQNLTENSNMDSQNLEASVIKPDALKSKSPAGRSLPVSSSPKPGGILESAKSIENIESSAITVGGDESFVVQDDDIMLNDIDADLLDSSTLCDSKAAESTSEAQGTVQDMNQKASIGTAQGSSATASAASKLAENTDTKDSSKGTSKDDKDVKSGDKSVSAQPSKEEKAAQVSRNLWVSGLSSSTRATDLKTVFSKYGKVIGAKVVTSARSPGSRCYGFVTMSTAEEATKSIQHLNRTELHGRMISVERAKTEPQGAKAKVLPPSGLTSSSLASSQKSDRKPSTAAKTEDKRDKDAAKPEEKKPDDKKDSKGALVHKTTEGKPHSSNSNKPIDKHKIDMDVLSFEKIKAERERERLRRKEMHLRHEERKHQLEREREQYRQRMIEKQQQEEALEIERERMRLREMRDELEREIMETERLKLETERLQIEREKDSYRREQQRLLHSYRPIKRSAERPVVREEEWPEKVTVKERYTGGDKRPRLERKPEHYEGKRPVKRESHEERGRGKYERERATRNEHETRAGWNVYEERGGERHVRPEVRKRTARDEAGWENYHNERRGSRHERSEVRERPTRVEHKTKWDGYHKERVTERAEVRERPARIEHVSEKEVYHEGRGGGGRHERLEVRERPARDEPKTGWDGYEERGEGRYERHEVRERAVHGDHETGFRDYGSREVAHRPIYRESLSHRSEKPASRSVRASSGHDSRSEWKSDRGAVSGQARHSKVDYEWDTSSMRQEDGWGTGVVMTQPGSGFAMQQGTIMTGGMGPGTVFIAQPAIPGTQVVMRQDGRFGVAATAAPVRRF